MLFVINKWQTFDCDNVLMRMELWNIIYVSTLFYEVSFPSSVLQQLVRESVKDHSACFSNLFQDRSLISCVCW